MSHPSSPHPLGRTRFETAVTIRPDDIDLNQHVHNSRYFDYVLAARYDQMERCYKMPMEAFIEAGFGWVVKTAHLNFKRPLGLGETARVTTWVDELIPKGVQVRFEIHKASNGKLSCDGYFDYTMIRLDTGRAETVPGWIIEKYAI
ncbi:MAG TPA: acyl-CoA thioesterase [Chthoniobacteraceae bacterium]|nr:acyl-CoA thioesterase [Chthoniobacteraceae bacterium]